MEKLENEGHCVYITGDFNVDNFRRNEFDQILIERIENIDYKFLDEIFTQKINHTYTKRSTKTWIDHVIGKDNEKRIKSINILVDEDNVGDHHAISIIMNIKASDESEKRAIKKLKFNWDSEAFKVAYKEIYRRKMTSMNEINKSAIMATDKRDLKNRLTILMNENHSRMRDSAMEARIKVSIEKTNTCKFLKRKFWWDKKLDELHQMKKEAYRKYKESEFASETAAEEFKKWKREFRKRQRGNQLILRDRRSNKLKYLYKTDKQGFWKEMEKQTNNKINTNASIDKLKQEFCDLFNKKIMNNSEQEIKSKEKVNKFIKKQSKQRT